MKNKLVTFFLAFVLILMLTACGGGGGGASKTTLVITATESGYDSPTYTIPAGAQVDFTFKNTGNLEHNFDIIKLGQHVASPFTDTDKDKIFWSLNSVGAQQSKTATFTAPTAPGEYDIICSVPGHIEMGMIAKLVVK